MPIPASGGGFALTLPGATMHTDLDNPGSYQVGGTPAVLVEERPCPCSPVQPATNLSPPAAPPFKPVASPG